MSNPDISKEEYIDEICLICHSALLAGQFIEIIDNFEDFDELFCSMKCLKFWVESKEASND